MTPRNESLLLAVTEANIAGHRYFTSLEFQDWILWGRAIRRIQAESEKAERTP